MIDINYYLLKILEAKEMKPLIREGVVWFQKQITGEGNPSSPHVHEKYQFSF